MIDAGLFAGAVAANVAGDYLTDKLVSPVSQDPQLAALMAAVAHLEAINKAVSRNSHQDMVVTVQPSPAEYVIPDHGRDHLSMYLPSQTTGGVTIISAQLSFAIPGVGVSTEQVFVGWTQLDLPPYTRIWTNDSNSYNVILSFRDNPIGDFL